MATMGFLDFEMPISFLFLIAFIAVFYILVYLFDTFFSSSDIALERRSRFFVLFEYNIRKMFTNQKKETLNTIMFGMRTIFGIRSERPCVLLFLINSETACTGLMMAKKLAQVTINTFENDFDLERCNKTVVRGRKYTSFECYWDFHRSLVKRLQMYKVAIIADFQIVHPHAATALINLADCTFSPFPQSLLIVLLDVNNFFSQRDLKKMPPVTLAESYLQHITSPFLESSTTNDLLRCTCGRAVVVEKENDIEIF